MKEITLGAKTYFVREESDERKEFVLFMVLGSDDPPLMYPDPTDVWVQDDHGKIVPVLDALTIEIVKAKATAQSGSPKSTNRSKWKHIFFGWLDEQIRTGVVRGAPTASGGKCWLIPRTKKSVYDELELKDIITLSTFKSAVQPKIFKYKNLPLEWANPGVGG